ncbi:MAG: DUF2188 domain-containing protein [Bryobacterales bacterium]|nr:DUF2188 domain-containing protein [Bryobacterales bacterium]
MPQSKTVHVIPHDGGWVVKREGVVGTVHPTKREAVERARTVLKRSASGQIVIHKPDGRVAEYFTYGMPRVQVSPKRGSLGTSNIEKAVNKLLLERLGGNQHRQHD